MAAEEFWPEGWCAFCGKTEAMLGRGRLALGPAIRICEECLQIGTDIVVDQKAKGGRRGPAPPDHIRASDPISPDGQQLRAAGQIMFAGLDLCRAVEEAEPVLSALVLRSEDSDAAQEALRKLTAHAQFLKRFLWGEVPKSSDEEHAESS